MKNLTCIFYTANRTSDYFFGNVKKQLLKATNGIPIISVSQKPIKLGDNICVGDIGQSQLNIYRQALTGAKAAKTKYIALAEDDVLYHKSHFDYVPKNDTFAYDRNIWNIYTWTNPPVFSYKGRRNLNGLICNRELFIKVMEERFAKFNEDNFPKHLFGEPGKYERQLGVKINKTEFYYPREPSIAFSHPTELSYTGLGRRKKIGEKAREELSPWGSAKSVVSLYQN